LLEQILFSVLGLEAGIKPKAAIAGERAIAAFGSDSAKWRTALCILLSFYYLFLRSTSCCKIIRLNFCLWNSDSTIEWIKINIKRLWQNNIKTLGYRPKRVISL
jgi:hypothetical protein